MCFWLSLRFSLICNDFGCFLWILPGNVAFCIEFGSKSARNYHLDHQTSMKSLIRPVSASQIVIETRRRARFPSGRGKTCTFDWKSWKRRQTPSFSDVQKTTISGRDRQKLPKWSQMSCVYRFLLWIEPCCQIGEKSWFWHWSTMVAKMCSKSIKFLLILLRNHVFPLRSHDFALEI